MFKYLKGLFLLRDITNTYEEEKGKGKPIYLSKRFIGVIIIAIGYLVTVLTGVQIDDTVLSQLTDSLEKMAAGLVILYGIVIEIVGIIQAILRKFEIGR